ncbi:unnamed protein product [Lactuca saligna]|uniref:Uncharacterized protein n=1 Tax=Lactuca saligna TaxID=75948 RepID=A0AA35ZEU8_LACSI|nr:unnamed protein product [Lactuca saligna]
MDEFQQGDPYYQALVADGWIEEVGPEEYYKTNYKVVESDKESDGVEIIGEIPMGPHPSEAIPTQHTIQEDSTDGLRLLGEEVATHRQQLFAAEARVVQSEQINEKITREMSDLADHVA